MTDDRLMALQVLTRVIQHKKPLSFLLQTKPPLSPFAKALCFGVCRHYLRLQALAHQLVSKKPAKEDVWLVLLMGIYQLHFLEKPDYAVVQESVFLLDKIKKAWAKGFINATLRRFCREKEPLLSALAQQAEFITGHPPWLIERLKADWPSQWMSILQANDEQAPMSLRVNRLHGSRDDYLTRLRAQKMEATPLLHSVDGIRLHTPCDVNELPGFAEGDVSVQDEAAQLAVSLLFLQPGLRVLDACAAPGGKTCHLLEREPLSRCVALDVDGERLKRVQENTQRLGVSPLLVQGDALDPLSWWDGQFFDRILLDAPCSALGVIRRHPDIKLLRTPDEVKTVVNLQSQLLHALWPLLLPGGLFVYATCSVLKEENEEQMARFLDSHQDGYLVKKDIGWGHDTGFGWQLLPGQFNNDGFFYCVLSKHDNN